MVYKVYNKETNEVIAEVEGHNSVHVFAEIYSKGSEDRPSCNVWVYQTSEDFGMIAISYYHGGTRFDRVSAE